MKNIFRKILTGVSALTMCMSMSMTAFAEYNWDTDEVDNEGNFVVDNYQDRDSKALLYIYADTSDITIKTKLHRYEMSYYGDDTETFDNGIIFYYRPENADVYAHLDGGDVWVFQFTIDNGWYNTGDSALNEDYRFPYEADPSTYGSFKYVENGTMHIYTMLGGPEWSTDENKKMFCEWAKENDENLSKTSVPSTEETTIEVSTETETEITIEETSAEVSSVETSIEEQTVEPEKTTSAPVDTVEKEKPNIIVPIVIVILCLGIVGIIVFIFIKKK